LGMFEEVTLFSSVPAQEYQLFKTVSFLVPWDFLFLIEFAIFWHLLKCLQKKTSCFNIL
jgi:hypothetical protein